MSTSLPYKTAVNDFNSGILLKYSSNFVDSAFVRSRLLPRGVFKVTFITPSSPSGINSIPIIGNKNEEAIDIRSANRRILFFFPIAKPNSFP